MGMFRKRERRSPKKAAFWAGATAAIAYFFDPQMGRTRRAKVRDKVVKFVNRGSDRIERKARYVGATAQGLKQRATHAGGQQAPENDQTLAHKIESEVLSRWNVPKGKISVNAEGGIVYLRGQLDDANQISEVEQEARKVTGVVDVVNLLHLPGEPAPNKEDALRASKP